MADTCPACGAEMEYSERAVTLRTGTCPSCAKAFAFVEGSTLSDHLPAPGESSGATLVGAPVEVAEDAPECDECGSALAFRTGRNGAILGVCSECETTTVYRPASESATEERERRAPRAEFQGPGGPRSRPCRKCGAPLRFSTTDDGLLVGECDACGNRFTLPPRESSDRPRGYSGRPQFNRSGYRPGGRRGTNYRSSGRSGGRPYGGSDRRGPPSDDDSRRRRRRTREE